MEAKGEERCIWPAPPPYYKMAKDLAPPAIIDDASAVVYDVPVLQSYKAEVARLEEQQPLFFESTAYGTH